MNTGTNIRLNLNLTKADLPSSCRLFFPYQKTLGKETSLRKFDTWGRPIRRWKNYGGGRCIPPSVYQHPYDKERLVKTGNKANLEIIFRRPRFHHIHIPYRYCKTTPLPRIIIWSTNRSPRIGGRRGKGRWIWDVHVAMSLINAIPRRRGSCERRIASKD